MTGWLTGWVASRLAGCLTGEEEGEGFGGRGGTAQPHLDQAEPGRVPIVHANIRLPPTAAPNTGKMWECEKMAEARRKKKKEEKKRWATGT